MDNGLIGSVINALPIDEMVSVPLQAMTAAQASAAKSHADSLLQARIQNGKAVAVQFDYDETTVDEKGVAQGTIQKMMYIPLLCAVAYPVTVIEEGIVDFELEIMQLERSSSITEVEGSFQARFGWGPFSVPASGRVSHKSGQTRSTDIRVKYSFHTQVKCQNPSEALVRVMEFSTDAATKPVVVKGKKNDAKPLPATSTDGTMIGKKVPADGNAPVPAPTTP